jgi:hypothetical protein
MQCASCEIGNEFLNITFVIQQVNTNNLAENLLQMVLRLRMLNNCTKKWISERSLRLLAPYLFLWYYFKKLKWTEIRLYTFWSNACPKTEQDVTLFETQNGNLMKIRLPRDEVRDCTQFALNRLDHSLLGHFGIKIWKSSYCYVPHPIRHEPKLHIQYKHDGLNSRNCTYNFGSFLKTASISDNILSAAGNGSSCIISSDFSTELYITLFISPRLSFFIFFVFLPDSPLLRVHFIYFSHVADRIRHQPRSAPFQYQQWRHELHYAAT